MTTMLSFVLLAESFPNDLDLNVIDSELRTKVYYTLPNQVIFSSLNHMGTTIKTGRGTKLIRVNGNVGVASYTEGRIALRLKEDFAVISIEPLLAIEKNIIGETINSNGHLYVRGNVEEKANLFALEDIIVDGKVYRSTLIAGKNVQIKDIALNNEITAGDSKIVIANTLLPIVKEIHYSFYHSMDKIERSFLLKDTKEIQEVLSSRQFQNMLQVYLTTLRSITTSRSLKTDMPVELILMTESIIQIMQGTFLLETNPRLNTFLNRVKDALSWLEENANYTVFGRFYTLDQCTVNSAGDIYVEGEGCINSNLVAEKTVKVNGIFRSGSIQAGNKIEIEEVGSQSVQTTFLFIRDPAGQIILKKTTSDIVLQVGKQRMVLPSNMYRVKVKANNRTQQLEIIPW